MVRAKKGRKVALVAGLALVVLSMAMVWTYWKEIRFFLEFERLGKNAQGYPEYRHRQTRIVFVGLPGGTFEMGSPEDEADREENEGPVHEVTLSPFLIAKYEVTQAEWMKVMGENPSAAKRWERRGELDVRDYTLPVEQVSRDECQDFCEKTSLSLPTEAQWEYACRAGKPGPFAGTGRLDDMGWYRGNSHGGPHPVGEKQPNDYGLHDMHGNVSEWCADWYHSNIYTELAGANDPRLENARSEYLVIRGGSWVDPPRRHRSAFRHKTIPADHGYSLGFRTTWSPP